MTRRAAPRLMCLGMGYSAQALAKKLGVADWAISGTARDPDAFRALGRDGVSALRFDGADADEAVFDAVAKASHVLISIPPDGEGDPAFRVFADTIAANKNLEWVGYLSTTGVYGDTQGRMVDEKAALNPSGPRGQRRVDAEAEWLSLFKAYRTPVHIFRLAGIYGPGRSVFDRIRKRAANRIDKPGHVFSRIHVDDIANVLAASIAAPAPGAIYNVCDNEPAPPAEVTAYACHLLDVEAPPLEDFETVKARMTPMGLSFWNDNRRVDNSKIRTVLGVRLKYPDYRAGLQGVLAEGG